MIYTWGYSERAPDDLQQLISKHDIRCIIDVRARPRSRQKGGRWNKAKLQARFPVRYIWAECFGNAIGMPPEKWTPSCAKASSNVARQLADVIAVGYLGNVLLLCLEQDPAKCHRSAVAEFIGGEIIHLGVPDA